MLQNGDRSEPFTIAPGDRIAQLLIVPVPAVELVEVGELPPSDRAERGFGSSAVRAR